MGLNFNRPDAPTQTAPAAQAELEQVKSYDIVVDRKQMSAEPVSYTHLTLPTNSLV